VRVVPPITSVTRWVLPSRWYTYAKLDSTAVPCWFIMLVISLASSSAHVGGQDIPFSPVVAKGKPTDRLGLMG